MSRNANCLFLNPISHISFGFKMHLLDSILKFEKDVLIFIKKMAQPCFLCKINLNSPSFNLT